MKLTNLNNLVELFFVQYEKQDKKKTFLSCLKNKSNKYSWEDTYENIFKLSREIKKYIKKL